MLHKFISLLALVSILFGAASCGGRPTALPAAPESAPPPASSTASPHAAPTSTAPPASSAQPTSEPDAEITADAFPPAAPFHVRFAEPLDPASAQPALLSYPWLEGDLAWDDDSAGLTFTPHSGFQPDRTYRLFLHPDLTTAAGAAPSPETEWELHTLAAPRLISRSPGQASLSERRPAVRLTFDQPMDPASVAAALSLEPELPFSLTWDKPTLALVELGEPLQPGQRYQFTLAATAADRRGVALSAPQTWEYWLPEWQVELTQTPSLKRPNAPIRLRFSQAVDRDSVERALRLEPALDYTITWNGGQELSLAPSQAYPAGTAYTLSFAGQIGDAQGAPLPPLPPLSLVTPPPIRYLRPEPGAQSVLPDTLLQIAFDRPMDTAKTQAALFIEPAAAGEFWWSGNVLNFRPEVFLDPFTTYTVTLATEAAGAQGEPILSEPFSYSFQTGTDSGRAYLSFGDYGPNAQVLDLDGRRALQFLASRQVDEVGFSLHRLGLNQFLDRYASGFRGVAGHERQPISLEGTSEAAAWTVNTRARGLGWSENVYESLVPAEVPAGLYILEMSSEGAAPTQLILILTRQTLLVKEAGGEMTVWASEINGGSLPGVEISIYARDGSLIDRGQTDEQGLYTTQIERDPQPLIVVGRQGEDFTVSGLSNEWSGRGGWWWGWWATPLPQPESYRAHLYTDRPIYRPGHSVYFKAVLRADDDASYTLPPAGTPVTVRIRDPRANVVQTFRLTTSSLGSLDGVFQLAEGAMLGEYFLEAESGGDRFRQVFKVQDYRKPDYEVSLSPGAAQYVMGDTIQVTLKAGYYFGEPVANAPVTVRRFYLEQNYSGWWAQDQTAEPDYLWYHDYDQTTSGRTDENGFFTFSLPAETREGYEYYDTQTSFRETVWGLEASVDDGSRQEVSGFTIVRVANSGQKLELDPGSFWQKPGEPFTVRTRAVTLSGEGLPDKPLKLELRRWDGSSYRYNTVVQSLSFAVGPTGRAAVPFTIREPGYYQLRLSGEDERGLAIIRSTWVYAFSGGEDWYSGRDSFSLSADRETYQPGETATLLIESSQAGPALLTFERGSVHREQIITLNPPLTTVPVQIVESDAPNIYVTVSAYEPQDTTLIGENIYQSRADSRLSSASLELTVPVSGKRLNVEILPDKERYAPREQATFTVRVTTEDGRPAQAEVALAVVDEAIFALSKDLTKPAFEAFYAARPNRVNTYNSMALTRELFLGGMGGGGGDSGGAGPRSDFPDTAAWFPALQTGPDGLATVSLVLPDSLTNWRITARAATGATQVGEASYNIVTHQEVVARLFLPRALTTGDQALLSGAVHNYAAEPRTLAVSLAADSASGELLRLDGEAQSVTLAPGEVRLFTWQAEALLAGEALLTLTAALPEGPADALRLPLPVRALLVPDLASQVSVFQGEFYTTFYRPPEALPSSYVELEISRSIAGAMLEGLEYLTGYPYGCVEQTMSRALPNAVVGRAFRQLGVENATLQADLPAQINAGLQRLYGYQHNDGGWGWWYDDSTDAFQTAWVVFGLAVTAEAGYEVDPGVIERGANWLTGSLPEMDPRLRAYALYSLATAGHGSPQPALELAERAYQLDTFSQSALALALHAYGEESAARQVLGLVGQAAQVSPEAVYWPSAWGDDQYYSRTMASTTRTSALALSALVRLDPSSDLIPGAAAWLMGQRRLEGWGHTNETSYAVLALSDYLLSTYSPEAQTALTVELNGARLAEAQIGGRSTAQDAVFTVRIPLEQMQEGINLLHVSQSGAGRLYAAARSRFDLPHASLPAAGAISLARQYLPPRGSGELESFEPGQLVRVRLTIQADQPVSFAILEDYLPGGLEALNESLNTTSHVQLNDYAEPTYDWRDWGYNNKEVRGGTVSFFITEIRPGRHTVEYLARATFPGAYTALPAQVSAMYDETLWGRSESQAVQVSEPAPAEAHAP